MMWEWEDYEDTITEPEPEPDSDSDSHLNFDFFSALSRPKVLHSLKHKLTLPFSNLKL